MMDKQNRTGLGVGSVSILAVFVVLCLTTLAALSFVSARADYRLADKMAASTAQYYEADTAAEQSVAWIVQTAEGSGAWTQQLRDAGYTVQEESDGALVSFDQPIDQHRKLHVEIRLKLQAGTPTGEWEREAWQTQTMRDAQTEKTLQVLQ